MPKGPRSPRAAPQPAAVPDPRAGALALLRAVLGARQTLPEARAIPATAFARADPPGQARALRLALATLRHLDRADAVLAPYLRKAPPEPALTLMRLAVSERMVFDAPAHAVVNAAVAMVRAGRNGAVLAGLVNAVLRKATAITRADWDALPPQRLPDWLRGRLESAIRADPALTSGAADVQAVAAVLAAIEASHARGASLDLTPRDPAQAGALALTLGARILPTGSLRLDGSGFGALSALPGYAEGAWWVQDAAAALPARLLAPPAGARVLDLCAAPGGKTLQLAAMGARVTALDVSGARMGRLRENLARTGLGAELVVADALDWVAPTPFDAVLLDAPCSASGTIRRHPDMPHARAEADLPAAIELQARLLDRVLDGGSGLLRPGGRVVYCTCSLLAEEGEAQVSAALRRHPGARLADPPLAGADVGWRARGGGWRTRPDFWPELGGLDGFFMAALET